MNKVIYTALMTKNADKSIDFQEPKKVTKGWDYICFTDDPSLKSDIWQFKILEPYRSARRNSRRPKIMNDEYLENYDLSIYIDARWRIKLNLDKFVKRYLGKYDIAMMKSPKRQCIYDEAKHCISHGLDPKNVKRQISKYRKEKVPHNIGLTRCGMMIRKHNVPLQEDFMKEWWHEYNSESERDTISFAYVYWKYRRNQLNINRLPTKEVYEYFR